MHKAMHSCDKHNDAYPDFPREDFNPHIREIATAKPLTDKFPLNTAKHPKQQVQKHF